MVTFLLKNHNMWNNEFRNYFSSNLSMSNQLIITDILTHIFIVQKICFDNYRTKKLNFSLNNKIKILIIYTNNMKKL